MEQLWMQILVSSAICLAISVITWRFIPLHRGEYRRLPTEALVLDAMRKDMPPPGAYSFPFRGFADDSETRIDVAANLERGPVGYLVIGPNGAPNILSRLIQHFVFYAIVAYLTSYIITHAGLKDGAPFLSVFRLACTVATMALVLGSVPLSIWFYRPWKSFVLQSVDGLACGAAIGATFAWFWPG